MWYSKPDMDSTNDSSNGIVGSMLLPVTRLKHEAYNRALSDLTSNFLQAKNATKATTLIRPTSAVATALLTSG